MVKKPKPPSRMLGTAGIAARKVKKGEKFDEEKQQAHLHDFEALESLLNINSPDATFREELVNLLDSALGFQAIFLEAPKRSTVHEEFKKLQTSIRRHPSETEKELSNLSPESLHRLCVYGLDETSSDKDVSSALKSALTHTPRSRGGRPVDEHHRFLVVHFTKLYKHHTSNEPTLVYNYYTKEISGSFIDCLCIVFRMVFSPAPTKEGIAQLYKRLFYKTK